MSRFILIILPLLTACAGETLDLSATRVDGGSNPGRDAASPTDDAGFQDASVLDSATVDVGGADAGLPDAASTSGCPPLTDNVRLERASRNAAGEPGNTVGTGSNWQGGDPAMSGDGRFVAFTSLATNLVPNDTEGLMDLFLFDRREQTTQRLHVGQPGGYGVAGDGSFVAYQTNSEGRGNIELFWTADGSRTGIPLVAGWLSRQSVDFSGRWIVADGPTVADAVNHTQEGLQTPSCQGRCRFASISADGRFLTYVAGGSLDQIVYRYDRDLEEEVRVSGPFVDPSWEPSISGDGQTIVYRTWPGDVFVWRSGDLQQFDVGGPGYSPSVDAAGCRMAVTVDGTIRVFDLARGGSVVVSRTMNGTAAAGRSSAPLISADGRNVAFTSQANDLLPGDKGNGPDIFVATID